MAAASKPHRTNNSRGTESDIDETIAVILVALAKAVGVLLWWSVLFPMISIPTLASVWIGVCYGPVFGLVLAAVSGLALAAWSQISPPSFQRWVTQRMRTQWRIWWVYRRRWTAICTLHGLTAKLDEQTLVPALCSVTIGATSDVVVVRILTGQSVADWQNKSEALAEALRARRVTIRSIKPGAISITAHHGDALATPIWLRRPATDTTVDLSSVRLGVTEAGMWWRLPVLGQHILVAGATGSGKGSVLWSIIAGLAPAVRTGQVRLCVIDPKGGMELGAGAPLFRVFCHDATGTTVELLRAGQTDARAGESVARPYPPPRPDSHRTPVRHRDRRDRGTDRLGHRPQGPHRNRTTPRATALRGPSGRYLGGGGHPRPLQRHSAGAAVVHRPDRATADRSHPNRDGAGAGGARRWSRMRPHPRRHPRGGLCDDRRHRRTPTGARLPRHRR
jgi:hypothetical protein